MQKIHGLFETKETPKIETKETPKSNRKAKKKNLNVPTRNSASTTASNESSTISVDGIEADVPSMEATNEPNQIAQENLQVLVLSPFEKAVNALSEIEIEMNKKEDMPVLTAYGAEIAFKNAKDYFLNLVNLMQGFLTSDDQSAGDVFAFVINLINDGTLALEQFYTSLWAQTNAIKDHEEFYKGATHDILKLILNCRFSERNMVSPEEFNFARNTNLGEILTRDAAMHAGRYRS